MAFNTFNKAQSSERIRRTLSINLKDFDDTHYINGDKVFFKRTDKHELNGPGVVIGQNGQFVLINYQNTLVRVHPCRMQLIHEENVTNEKLEPIIIPVTQNNSNSHFVNKCEQSKDRSLNEFVERPNSSSVDAKEQKNRNMCNDVESVNDQIMDNLKSKYIEALQNLTSQLVKCDGKKIFATLIPISFMLSLNASSQETKVIPDCFLTLLSDVFSELNKFLKIPT